MRKQPNASARYRNIKSTAGRRRVTFVATDVSTGGGVNRVICDLSALFARNLGLYTEVLVARSATPPTYRFDPAVRLRFGGSGGIFHYIRQLWQLRSSRSDFVIGSWTQDNIILLAVFLFSKSRVIVVEHSSWDFHGPIVRALRWVLYRCAFHVVALNPTDELHYRRYLANVSLIPNPVKRVLSSRSREKLLIAVGHLESLKNFDDAIHAFHQSMLDQDGWTFSILGSGSKEAHLRELGRRLGVKNLNIVTEMAEVGDWYARASLIAVTSVTEVFSLALAEAMAAGVIPIAYKADGPTFLLEDFPEHLVTIGDVDGLAARMARFARMHHRDDMREAFRHSVDSRFSPEFIAAEWRRLLG